MTDPKKKKKKYFKPAPASWLVLFAVFVIFAVMLIKFPVTPLLWRMALLGVITLIVALFGLLSFRKTKKKHNPKIGTTVLNVILAIFLAAGSWLLPHVEKRVDEVFTPIGETVTTTINVYALTTDYKTEHIDIFKETNNVITSTNLQDYKNSVFITQSSVDQENQNNAVAFINQELNTTISENNCETIWDAVAALYAGDGAALILNEGYVSSLEETDTYASFSEDTIILRTITIEMEAASQKETAAGTEASTDHSFAIYFGGSDSRDSALSIYTRTDVNIVGCVDPVNKQIMLISIPRDLYVQNPYLNNGYDKLTHLGNSGIQNTVEGFNQLLDADVGNYVVVNFSTYTTIVNALGGIDVNNPYEFSAGNYYFPAGYIHISGDEALAYVRERYSLSNGDFGRNEHQTIVLKAILQKILSAETITKFDSLLSALAGTFATNITSDQIYALVNQQISAMTTWNIVSYHVDAWGEYGETASMPGQQLYINHPYQNQLDFLKGEYDKIMAGEIITQQSMPAGE